jgi:hypothetical protein
MSLSHLGKTIRLSVAVAAVTLFAGVAHADTVYDAVADFSLGSNPNGVWSYGTGTPGSTTTLYTYSGTTFTSHSNWNFWGTAQDDYHAVGLNSSGTANGTMAPTSDELWLHPGNSNDGATEVIFTAPVTGFYDYSALFSRADSTNNGNGVNVYIYVNGMLIHSGYIGTGTGASWSSTDAGQLDAGDVLTFVVDRNGDYSYDSTGLKLTVTQLTAVSPEPSSIALMGTGLISVAGAFRRKLRK